MKIEEAIQQKGFKSPQQKALINIVYTGLWIQSKQSELLRSFDISLQQFNVLRILKGVYPNSHTIQSVKSRMLDKTPNTTRLIDKLEQKDLVCRERCTEDRRVIFVQITDEGLKVVNEMTRILNSQFNAHFNLSDDEANQLSNLLDCMRM